MNICVIPAKKDSSRLADKNMRVLNNKPLIWYSIEQAKSAKLVDKVFVSTDSPKIADYAKGLGVGVIMRGKGLSGEADVVDVYIDALNKIPNKKIEYIIGLQPDHPDRKIKIDDAINYMISHNYNHLVTVDKKGIRNGSVFISKVEALRAGNIARIGSLMDDCTNIHYQKDLLAAEKNMRKIK